VDKNYPGLPPGLPKSKKRYVTAKKVLALLLTILFVVMVLHNIVEWLFMDHSLLGFFGQTKMVTEAFFSDFFMVLILTDLLVLLFSFAITDDFPKVMRNSGFVVSTTLIKLSFSVEGIASHLLVVMAVLFGTLMLRLYKMYRRIELPDDNI
jgi:Ca2+/Na+ antiporter